MGIFVFKGGSGYFFQIHSKGLYKHPNDSRNHPEWLFWSFETWDIFGTIPSLKIIFWDYIFEKFRLKMNKNTFFGILWLYKGNHYIFKLRNEEFRYLRSWTKSMDLIFWKLKKAQKAWIQFFASLKKLKKMNLIFCKLKKAQKIWI